MIKQDFLKQRIAEACSVIREHGIPGAEIGIVLGTGLGDLINEIDVEVSVNYDDIPHFATPTVETHSGRLIYGTLGGKKVLAMQGRFHYYEGYNMKEITFPIYALKEMGIRNLFISNAAGNMNLAWSKGELMLVDDHINLLPENPLRGVNDDSIGSRFPDMAAPYDPQMNDLVRKSAAELNIELREGVYVSVQGPNLETRAEYRMLRNMGADAVGMSTVPEVLAANHIGLPVSTISVLTDDCDPDNLEKVNIQEILAIAGKAEKVLSKLITKTIEKL